MSKSKFYAVKSGRSPGIYESWSECQEQIKGFAGALFKSFSSLQEAQDWMKPEKLSVSFADASVKVYVDGSFVKAGQPAGWGWVAVENETVIGEGCGKTPGPALSRNIDGELHAAIEGARFLKERKTRGVICHDYAGIAHWAKGEWKAKSEIAQWYQKEIEPYLEWICFEKVAAHSGHRWNDRADELAKAGLGEECKLKWSALGEASEATINYLIRFALENPHVISLAAGLVDPEAFPVRLLDNCAQAIFKAPQIKRDLQYNSTQGDPLFLKEISLYLNRAFDESVDASRLLVGNGSQQILYLFNQVALNKGDIVLIEDPSYYVYMDALKQTQVKMLKVACDDEGMIPEALDETLKKLKSEERLECLKGIYTITYCQNPTGRSYTAKRKREIIGVMDRWVYEHPFFLLEDAAYRELSFAEPPPSFGQLGVNPDFYLYCGTFSKALAPGLRLGYGVMSQDLMSRMINLKGSQDFGSSTLNQAIVREFLRQNHDHIHYPFLKKSYRLKAEMTAQYLHQYLPSSVKWKYPQGGLYFWVELPSGIDTGMGTRFFERCLEEGVLYVPGELFYNEMPQRSVLRLTYAFQELTEIEKGIRILGQVIGLFLDD